MDKDDCNGQWIQFNTLAVIGLFIETGATELGLLSRGTGQYVHLYIIQQFKNERLYYILYIYYNLLCVQCIIIKASDPIVIL